MCVYVNYAGKSFQESDELGQAIINYYDTIILTKLDPVLDDIIESGGALLVDINKGTKQFSVKFKNLPQDCKARIDELLFERA